MPRLERNPQALHRSDERITLLLGVVVAVAVAVAAGSPPDAQAGDKRVTAEKVKEMLIDNVGFYDSIRHPNVISASETSAGSRLDSGCIPGRDGIDTYHDVSEGKAKITGCNGNSGTTRFASRDFQAEIDRTGNRVARAANVGKNEHGSTRKVKATRRKAVIRFNAPDTITDRSVKALKVSKRGKITSVSYSIGS